jgi:hypothetical protein
MGSDVDESGDRGIIASFGDDGSAIAVSDEKALAILQSEDPLCSSNIFLKGGLGLLYDAHAVTVSDENVRDAFPAGAICPGSVDENDIANPVFIAGRLDRRRRLAGGEGSEGRQEDESRGSPPQAGW